MAVRYWLSGCWCVGLQMREMAGMRKLDLMRVVRGAGLTMMREIGAARDC